MFYLQVLWLLHTLDSLCYRIMINYCSWRVTDNLSMRILLSTDVHYPKTRFDTQNQLM